MLILCFIIIGLFTGLLAGLLGIGGGIITVPALFLLFHHYSHFPSEHLMHACIATALATTLITSLGSTWAHHKRKMLLPSVLKLTAPGLVIGSLLGIALSSILSSFVLQVLFGLLALILSVYFFFPKLPQFHIASHPTFSLSLFSCIVGAFSTLLGIGGGMFMVPLLLGYKVPLPQTIANSSAGTLVTAFMGTLVYLIIQQGGSPVPHSIGYVDIPAMFLMGLSSLCTTSLGCRLAHTLPHVLTKQIFSLLLLATGISMLL